MSEIPNTESQLLVFPSQFPRLSKRSEGIHNRGL